MNKILISALVTILIILSGCGSYNFVTFSTNEFFGKNKVVERMDDYDVYIHKKDSTFKIKGAVVAEDSSIIGRVSTLDSTDITEISESPTTKLTKEQRNDIHIYLEEDNKVSEPKVNERVILESEDIETVKVSAKNNTGVLGVTGTMLILAAVLIGLLFLILIATLVAASSNTTGGTSDSGDSGSGDSSGGGSNSGSGGSDSGSGGSGGSNSGCYVATMVYGSYEAPEVLVLRRFRDQVLQKFVAGRAFIAWYYKNSPGFVEKNKSKKYLNRFIKGGLNIVVRVLKPLLK